MFTKEVKPVKIEANSDGTFNIRRDNSSYLEYKNGSWIKTTDKASSKLEIYKKINDNFTTNKLKLYNHRGKLISTRNIKIGKQYILPDYKTIASLPDDAVFKGWTTVEDSNLVEYNVGNTIEITENTKLYPIFEYVEMNHNYIFDSNVIIGETMIDNLEEINEGKINVYLHYGLSNPIKKTIYYKYQNTNCIDISIKFLTGYDEDVYNNKINYLIDKTKFPSSKYIITKVLVTQDSSDSSINLSNNYITENGGLLNNVAGESDIHVYLSLKYSTDFIINGSKEEGLSQNNNYVINPKEYDIISGFENAVDSSILNDSSYNDPRTKTNFIYEPDLSNYLTEIELPNFDNIRFWQLDDYQIEKNEKVSVYSVADKARDNIITFTAMQENVVVENPNTVDNIIPICIIMIVSLIGVISCIWYMKEN